MAVKRTLWFFLFSVAALIAGYAGMILDEPQERNEVDSRIVARDVVAQAKYDLQHHKAKLYIYGLVFEDEMKTRYKNHEVQLVYRGCMIGGADYKREMRYNRVVKKALGLPLDELDLEKI